MELPNLFDAETALLNDEFSEQEPAIWIKELRFLSECSPHAEEKCKIELRRGLNVVWAKPFDAEAASSEGAAMAGHAAGKTTFCRMLRYALGEPHFANEVVTHSIRDQFPQGCVCAEILVEGEQWSVCRPVSSGYHPKCMQNGDIDQLLKDEGWAYEEFRDRLEQLASSIMRAPVLPNDVEMGFQHILPWLSRDQEAGYRDLTEWRDKSSNAKNPFERQDDQYFCMRSLLSLISDEEIGLVKERDEANRKMEEARTSSAKRIARQEIEHDRLFSEAEGLIDFSLLELSISELLKSLEETRELIILADEESPMLKAAEKKYRGVSVALELAVRDLKMFKEVALENRQRYRMQQAKDAQNDQEYQRIEREARRHPGRKYCAQPLEVARAEGCPLCQAELMDFSSERELQKEQSQADRFKKNLELAEENVKQQRSVVDGARTDERKARAHYDSLRKAYQGEIKKNRDKYSDCDRLIRDLKAFEKSAEQLEQEMNNKDRLADQIGGLTGRIAAYRVQAKRQLGAFSASYNRLLREVLGAAVTGSVKLHGTSFRAKAEYNGELTSAAIESLKTILFDLTAIVFALNGNAKHPCFLIHDGPRAADLDSWLYKKIFNLMYDLEQRSNCSFQYIITTTEPPPTKLQEKPWLVETLDASTPKGRLLGVNL